MLGSAGGTFSDGDAFTFDNDNKPTFPTVVVEAQVFFSETLIDECEHKRVSAAVVVMRKLLTTQLKIYCTAL